VLIKILEVVGVSPNGGDQLRWLLREYPLISTETLFLRFWIFYIKSLLYLSHSSNSRICSRSFLIEEKYIVSILMQNAFVNDNLLCCGRDLFIQHGGNSSNQAKNLDAVWKPQRILYDQDIKSGRTSNSALFLISNLAIFLSHVSTRKTFAKYIGIIVLYTHSLYLLGRLLLSTHIFRLSDFAWYYVDLHRLLQVRGNLCIFYGIIRSDYAASLGPHKAAVNAREWDVHRTVRFLVGLPRKRLLSSLIPESTTSFRFVQLLRWDWFVF